MRFDLILYGSFGSDEYVEILIDGVSRKTVKTVSDEEYGFCEWGVWSDYLVLFNVNVTSHTSSSAIVNIHTSNGGYNTEGSMLRNYYLYVDTCDESCLTCSGPSDVNK